MNARCHFIVGASSVVMCMLAACGGGSSAVPPPPPTISVSISPTAVTVPWGATTQLIATVNNDSSGKGVNWKVSCSSAPCGALSSTPTASGTPITYTPPVVLPAANLSVTLTATSVADLTKSASAAVTVPQLQGFTGVSEANVDKVNGVARLIINGKPAPPLIFMYQEDFPNNQQFLAPQVQDAVNSGIHLCSISYNFWAWDNQGTAPLDFSQADQEIDKILAVDPKAILLPEVSLSPGPGWIPPVPPTAADQILYLDGPTTDVYHVSMASDIYFNGFMTSLPTSHPTFRDVFRRCPPSRLCVYCRKHRRVVPGRYVPQGNRL